MGSSYSAPEFDESIVRYLDGTRLLKSPWKKSEKRMLLKLKRDLFGGCQDYIVYDFAASKYGQALLRIQSRPSSKMNDNLMLIRHLNGKLMAILRCKQQLSGVPKYILQNAQNQTVCIISKDSSLIAHNIFIKSPDEKKTFYYVHGTFEPHRFAISDKKCGLLAKSTCSDKASNFEIEMCKGLDYVIIISLIAAIGEYERQQKSDLICSSIWKIIAGSL